MEVRVLHGLSSRTAYVHANGESIGSEPLVEARLDPVDQKPARSLLAPG